MRSILCRYYTLEKVLSNQKDRFVKRGTIKRFYSGSIVSIVERKFSLKDTEIIVTRK